MSNKMEILIVDDNAHYRTALRSILSRYPEIEKVYECEDGDEVLTFLEKNPSISIILMDISMKRMDGIEATRLVKQARPELPVLILSMHDEETYIQRIMEIGANGFLPKNVGIKDLMNAINSALAGGTTF